MIEILGHLVRGGEAIEIGDRAMEILVVLTAHLVTAVEIGCRGGDLWKS